MSSRGFQSLKNLSHGPVGVLRDEDADGSSNVWGGHGSSRHGDVVVSTSSTGDNVATRSRNFWFPVSSNRSSGREGAHGVSVCGRSNTNEALLISGRVGSSAAGSRVSKSKNWDDTSIPPGSGDLVKPSGSGSTSPRVGDNVGLGVSSGHELTTSDKIGFSSRSLVVKTSAGDPPRSWGNSDTVGTSEDGASAVRTVSLNISGSSSVGVWVQPGTSISLGESSVSDINSGVDDPSNTAGTVVDRPGLRSSDLLDSPLSILSRITSPLAMVDGVWVDGGGVFGTDVEGSWGSCKLGKGFSRESLDKDDIGAPELFNLESEGVGDGNKGSLGGGGGSLESRDEGGYAGITGQGLEGGGANDVVDDGWELNNGFGGLSSKNGVLQGDVQGAGGGNCHKGGDY